MFRNITIDENTGEIIGDMVSKKFSVMTEEDMKNRRKHAEKDKLTEIFKQMQSEYCGNFVFFIFKNMNFLNEILNDNDLVKFIYIGTYVKRDGYLIEDNNVTYITKKHLEKLLNVSRNRFAEFYNKLVDNNLIYEEVEKLRINLDYFYKGNKGNYKTLTNSKLDDFTRIYIDTTRKLYLNTPIREHKQLAIIYKLLPFVNWKYNILCQNINETDKNRLEVLTVRDVMTIFGFHEKQYKRFAENFYSLKCGELQIFRSVQYTACALDNFIVVNPLVFFRGNDIEDLQYLCTLFDIKPRG